MTSSVDQLCFKVVFTSSPVPLNRRLTIAPVSRAVGYTRMYGNRKRTAYEMVLTAEYRSWLKEQVRILAKTKAQLHLPTISTSCVAVVVWERPADNRLHDVDGVLKAPFDALTQAQIIKDDHLISAAAIVTRPPKGEGSMYLMLSTLDEDTVQKQSRTIHALLSGVS